MTGSRAAIALQMTTNNQCFELIETMRADSQGQIPLLQGHLQRLHASAQSLGFNWPGQDTIKKAIEAVFLNMAVLASSTRIRLLMSAVGQLQITAAPLPELKARTLVALAPLKLESQESLLQFKTTHRPWYEPTTQWLTEHHDFFDLIFLNERDELCEGSRSNVYVKDEKNWLTPPLTCGLLGGVMRQHLLDTGQVREAVLTRADFEQPAAILRLSNGLRGWFDVQPTQSLFPGRDFP